MFSDPVFYHPFGTSIFSRVAITSGVIRLLYSETRESTIRVIPKNSANLISLLSLHPEDKPGKQTCMVAMYPYEHGSFHPFGVVPEKPADGKIVELDGFGTFRLIGSSEDTVLAEGRCV